LDLISLHLASTLAWPVIAAICIARFGKSINALLNNITEIKFGSFVVKKKTLGKIAGNADVTRAIKISRELKEIGSDAIDKYQD